MNYQIQKKTAGALITSKSLDSMIIQDDAANYQISLLRNIITRHVIL